MLCCNSISLVLWIYANSLPFRHVRLFNWSISEDGTDTGRTPDSFASCSDSAAPTCLKEGLTRQAGLHYNRESLPLTAQVLSTHYQTWAKCQGSLRRSSMCICVCMCPCGWLWVCGVCEWCSQSYNKTVSELGMLVERIFRTGRGIYGTVEEFMEGSCVNKPTETDRRWRCMM